MVLKFGQKIKLNHSGINFYYSVGKIIGKIKHRDIYLCSFSYFSKDMYQIFGQPIRHINLEWGNFSGGIEFFIPAKFIEEI